MANPFWKSLAVGTLKRNRLGLAAYIRIDPKSMHSNRAINSNPPQLIKEQSLDDGLYMGFGRLVEIISGQFNRYVFYVNHAHAPFSNIVAQLMQANRACVTKLSRCANGR